MQQYCAVSNNSNSCLQQRKKYIRKHMFDGNNCTDPSFYCIEHLKFFLQFDKSLSLHEDGMRFDHEKI